MREILFRGKRIDNGEWVEGLLSQTTVIAPNKPAYVALTIDELGKKPFDGCWHEVDPDTVGQYTGLTDKNGKKIFEGDIVLGRFEFGMKVPSLVVFRDGAFGLEWEHAGKTVFTVFTGFCNVTFEVIGNVFDNPELLNKEA